MQTKVCKKCGTEKPVDAFPRYSQMKDGFRNECKPCKSLIDRARREGNIDLIRQSDRERYARDPERKKEMNSRSRAKHYSKRIAGQRAYYQENKQAAYKSGKRWVAANKDKVRAISKAWRARNRDAVRDQARSERIRLTDGYVRHVLVSETIMPRRMIPQSLVEAKRVQLQIKRFLKEKST